MIVNEANLKHLKPTEGKVTFGDDIKGQIQAVDTLNVLGLPRLEQVLLVQSLKEN